MIKFATFKTKGMQRDLSASAFNSDYSYENKNVRVMPTDESTLLSLINEKGNKKSNIAGVGDHIKGIPIGQALVNNELIIFAAGDDDYRLADITPDIFEAPDIFPCDILITDLTAGEDTANDITPDLSSIGDITFIDCPYKLNIDVDSMLDDRIYKLWFNNGALTGKRLFRGDLGFNYKHPIEAISFYENTDIRKVYWVDGKNPPRVINIMDEYPTSINSKTIFDFTPTLKLNEEVNIVRDKDGGGNFAPGVIQYTFSYYDSYGRESNLFYTSPLYYISYNNRGGSPEESVSCSFNITIYNVDTSFDYLRIYSIQRTSIDSTPIVKRVTDISIKENSTNIINYIDNGLSGDIIDNTSLFYIGGEDIIAGTISQKDNVLFLGDFKTRRETITQELIDSLRTGIDITFLADKELVLPEPVGNYPYNNQLGNSSVQIKTFKYLEYYRFGVQFQHYTGRWSEPIWLGDKQNLTKIRTSASNEGDISSSKIYLVEAMCNIINGLDAIKNLGYVKARPVIVYPNINDRTCICQGILCPTVYNIQDRYSNSPFAQSSWFARPNAPFEVYTAVAPDRTLVGFKFNCYFKLDEAKEFTNTYSGSDGNNIYTYVSHTTTTVVENEVQVTYINSVTMMPSRPDRSPSMDGYLMSSKIFSEDADSYYNLIQYTSYTIEYSNNSTLPSEWSDLDDMDVNLSVNSPYGLVYQNNILNDSTLINETRYGYWAEFRHDWPIPDNSYKNAEIQCIWGNPDSPVINSAEYSTEGWVHDNSENYFIDQSIITLHSPEIEFDTEVRNLDTSNLKLRIIGVVPITSSMTDIDIQTSSASLFFKDSQIESPGFYKENVGSDNLSRAGYRGIISGVFWMDEVYNRNSNNPNQDNVGFVIYPWHRSGSLNNQKFADSSGNRSSMLEQKKMSNLRYSYKTIYLDYDNLWMAYDEYSQAAHPGVSDIQVFDSNEVTLLKLEGPNDTSINYYGNVDKVLTYSRVDYNYLGWNKQNGYPIIVSDVTSPDIHDTYLGNYSILREWNITDQAAGVDPIRIKYKSTPHAVITLNAYKNQDSRSSQLILPTIYERGNIINYCNTTNGWHLNQEGYKYFWEQNKNTYGIIQSAIELGIDGETNLMQSTTSSTLGYGWLWLGELYREEVINRFGGTSQEALENNSWLPCGKSVDLDGNSITLHWTEGDTYYQRYDHVKTYPFTLEDPNSITEIISFMCETRVNIDGRYDKNRGQVNNLAITSDNFNLINSVYSQFNNFFSYRAVDPNKLNLNNFHNSITWTKTKTAGELVDTWTNITLASTLDLDGDKGSVRALRRFNNNLIAFQDKGISQILYNENMQITSTEGVPIEIANSGKVSGKRYITDKVGCTNKWSICETPNGLYFIDDITKGVFLFNGQLNNISDKFGFHSWINKASKNVSIWNPVDFDSFVTYYDKVNGDVFFISKDECLAFSEPLGQFTSFYSYEKMPYFTNLEDRGISFNVEGTGILYRPWLHNEGDYNMFFGVYQPFYTTIIANPDMPVDKIFNNLEFRSDSWDKNGNLLNTTFDTLTVWNEYQQGTSTLNNILGRPSDLKKKFRIWRANIPRANAVGSTKKGRDRMRNPWLYIKLSMEEENINKTVLHDMIVHYLE